MSARPPWIFITQIKGAILDAVDEGLIPRDPTRKVIIKGKQPRIKKMKYLNQFELHAMLADLDLGGRGKLGLAYPPYRENRTSDSLRRLGSHPMTLISHNRRFPSTKLGIIKTAAVSYPRKTNRPCVKCNSTGNSSCKMSGLLKDLPHDKPIFVHGKVYNSTANDVLAKHCRNVDVPVISVHGLRHTHASLLLFAGVSIASVSRRLGHASMTTTQETYLHVIRELENKDVDIVMRALSTLI